MSKVKQAEKKTHRKTEYDSAWKDIMEEHFESFLEFFFGDIHKDIDFSREYEFLSHELRKLAPGNKTGKRLADVLVKVYLKDGSEKYICIYIHIEVQGSREPDFMVRMYVYNYRIFDKNKDKGVEVISLAILTDEDENFRPEEYIVKRWGFEQRMRIPIVKIIDYRTKKELIDKLENSPNPMAMVVKAQLRSYDAKRSGEKKKYGIKWDLIRQCFGRGYNKPQIVSLLKFIDWIIRLPGGLEDRLFEEISKIEEEQKMPYVTSWERIGEKKGKIEGMIEGEKKGIRLGKKEGKREGKREGIRKMKVETAKRMLDDNFSIENVSKYTGLEEKEIRGLMDKEAKYSSTRVSKTSH